MSGADCKVCIVVLVVDMKKIPTPIPSSFQVSPDAIFASLSASWLSFQLISDKEKGLNLFVELYLRTARGFLNEQRKCSELEL